MSKDSQRHIKFNKYSKKGCRKIHVRYPFYVISTNNLKINQEDNIFQSYSSLKRCELSRDIFMKQVQDIKN